MDEIEIRRLFISDNEWERTSESWKKLKPRRNFNQISIDDESPRDCFVRLNRMFNIPIEVIEQWLYKHYYDQNSVNNFGWIDYAQSEFRKTQVSLEWLREKVNVVNRFRGYVESRSKLRAVGEFQCMPKDKKHWLECGTWRVPPIVLDVASYDNVPDYAQITAPFQLIEGHTRLGYLFSMIESPIEVDVEHDIYLLSSKRINA